MARNIYIYREREREGEREREKQRERETNRLIEGYKERDRKFRQQSSYKDDLLIKRDNYSSL